MNHRRRPIHELPVIRTLVRAWSTLRLAALPRPWPLELPVVVQFPVNDVCDSKCQMCNIWQRRMDSQVSPAEARRLFADPLFKKVTAIGFNGGEPTLRADLAEMGDAVCDSLPSLKSVSIISNGLHARRAITRIDQLAERLARRHVGLDVMISLDGVGDTHDRVRGVPGNFEQAMQVIEHLQSKSPQVALRIGCTIIRDNVYGLHELLDFCRTRDLYVKFRLGVPHKRLYNLDGTPPKTIGKRTWIDTHPFELTDAEHWHVGQFLLGLAKDYEPSLLQRMFYHSLADQVLYGKPRRAGCDWQHRGATVSSRGELMYCAVQSETLGDVREGGAKELYFGRQDHLQQILRDKCSSCAHDYVGQPGGRQQIELFADAVSKSLGLTPATVRRLPGHAVLRKLRVTRAARQMQSFRQQLAAPAAGEIAAAATPAATIVCGWYGTETLGDKAILAATVAVLRQVDPASPVQIASLDPTLTRLTIAEMPELHGCEVVSVDEALASVAGSRALVFGGGPLMAITEMAQMEALFMRAKAAGVPSIVAGCGVGPIGGGPYRASIASLLANADARIYRDEESRSTARSLGIDSRHDDVCEDPAFSWLETTARATTEARSARGPTIALGLRDWPYRQYAADLSLDRAERVKAEFESAVVEALDKIIAQHPGLTLLPVPFCTHDAGGDDRLLYWRLARRSTSIRRAMDTSLIAGDLGPHRYAGVIRTADACLAMRFHSIVFAAALGRPVVALDYTLGRGKSDAIARRLGIAPLPIDRISSDSIAQALHAALAGESVVAPPPRPMFAETFARRWRALVPAAEHRT